MRGRPLAEYRDTVIIDTRCENAVYHDRGDGHYDNDLRRWKWWTGCGKPIGTWVAWLPRWRADKIARPCKRCFPEVSS